jgi:hypothetical protein
MEAIAWVRLSAVCCLLSAVCCLLSAVCCLLSAVCCLLSAVCCLQSEQEEYHMEAIAWVRIQSCNKIVTTV